MDHSVDPLPLVRVAVGSGSDLREGVADALHQAEFGKLKLRDQAVALAIAPDVDPATVDALTRQVAARGGTVVPPSADSIALPATGALAPFSVRRDWAESPVRMIVAHNRVHPRWVYLGAMTTVLSVVTSPPQPGVALPEAARSVLDARAVHFALTDAWTSRDRRRDCETQSVIASASPLAVDWLAGEKMEIDPSFNPLVREALLRWGAMRLRRLGDLTPWGAWQNIRPITAVMADLRGRRRREKGWTWTTP